MVGHESGLEEVKQTIEIQCMWLDARPRRIRHEFYSHLRVVQQKKRGGEQQFVLQFPLQFDRKKTMRFKCVTKAGHGIT